MVVKVVLGRSGAGGAAVGVRAAQGGSNTAAAGRAGAVAVARGVRDEVENVISAAVYFFCRLLSHIDDDDGFIHVCALPFASSWRARALSYHTAVSRVSILMLAS